MRVNPHLSFKGECEAAFTFYEKCLGGKITFMMSYGDSPLAEQTALERRAQILHATLTLGDDTLTGGDVAPESYHAPQGISVSLQIRAAAEAERIFNALAEKGVVQMPMQETFWALRFGMVVDRFGTPWMVNCAKHV